MDLIEGELKNPINHWYYSHKFKTIHNLLCKDLPHAKCLVDVGAGSALFSREFLKSFEKLTCYAVDTGYALEQIESSTPRLHFSQIQPDFSGDIYLLTDVLEHVDDPVLLLNSYSDKAAPGTKFIITVPAHTFLWSGHDVFLKHFKRFNRKEVREIINQTSLDVVSIKYLYTPLFPLALLYRLKKSSQISKSQMRDIPEFLNTLFKKILVLDSLLSRISPFGVSIIALAEKSKVS